MEHMTKMTQRKKTALAYQEQKQWWTPPPIPLFAIILVYIVMASFNATMEHMTKMSQRKKSAQTVICGH